MPQSQVNAITQDSRGYLWIASNGGGISKFDGLNFQNYNEKNGLSGNIVNALCEDKKGNIWSVSSWGGVSKYNGRKFITFNNKDGLLDNDNNSTIFSDNSGKIWIGSNSGITTYYNGTFKNFSPEKNHFQNYDIHCIIQDSKNNIWIGGENGITFISEKDTFQIQKKDGLPSNSIYSICEDFDGNILIGLQNNGITKLLIGSLDHQKDYKFEIQVSIPQNLTAQSIIKDKEKNTWIATDNDGIYVFKSDKTTSHITKENGLPTNNINKIYEDKLGNIWIGTMGGGLVKYANKAFLYYNNIKGLNSPSIFSITKDDDDHVWIASSEDGVFEYDGEKIKQYSTINGFTNNTVRSIVKDKSGSLWFATQNGLVKYSNGIFKTLTTSHGLPTNNIRSLLIDKDNNLWIGTYGKGLAKYENGEIKTLTTDDGLSHNFIHSLFQDTKGNIWAGTGNGVNKITPNQKIHNYSQSKGFCNPYIGTITEDNYGNMWFGTDRCIVVYNGLDFKPITAEDGLSSGVIYLIHNDKNGNIWVGTNNGLDKITLNSYGQIKHIKNYKAKQGFKGVECNSRAIYEDKLGNLWIGTVKGLVKYNPKEDRANVFEPTLHINNIKLYLEDVDWLNYSKELSKWDNLPMDLSLKHDQNHITFEFSAINLTSPEDIMYRYKLKPFDENWYQVTQKNSATYSNLPPGKYTFCVKAKNNDNVWNQQPLEYHFTITPPFWKTWWFYVVIAALLFYVIYKLSSYREKQQLAISKELEIKVKERTQLIESQRDEKEVLLKEIHHRVKNNLQVINSLLSIQSGYTKDERALELFDEAKNRIRSMALIHEKMYQTGDLSKIDFQDYIISLTDDLIQTYSINCDIFLDIKIEKIKFNIDTLIPIGLLLNEIISNALKYAFNGTNKGSIIIHLNFDKETNHYTLLVGDNGTGISEEVFIKEDGSLGMELIKIFVSQLDGEIELLKQTGSMYKIVFPPRK